MNFDAAFSLWLNGLTVSSALAAQAAYFFALLLPWGMVILFGFFALFHGKGNSMSVITEVIGALFLSRGVLTESIRLFYDRLRPFEVLSGISPLLEHSGSGSFPSGHAAFFFALGTSVFFHHKKWGTAFLLAALLISVGRVASGVHYGTDVIGGALLGIFYGIAVHAFVLFLHKRKEWRVHVKI